MEPKTSDYRDFDAYRDALAEHPTDPFREEEETLEERELRMRYEDEVVRRPIVRGVTRK